MNKLYCLTFLFLTFRICNAQSTFEQKYHLLNNIINSITFGTSIEKITDGNFIIGGTSNNESLLMKINLLGDTIWAKIYNVRASNNIKAHQTYDGGYIVSGGNIVNSLNPDFGLIKTDSMGDVEWAKSYGGSGSDLIYDIHQTLDSGFIMVGFTESFGSGLLDIYVIKTDSNGDTLWSRTYGSSLYDYGKSITLTKDTSYVITGHVQSGTNGYMYLLKINNHGDSLWTRTYVNPSGISESIHQTDDLGFLISGNTAVIGPGGFSGYLLKTDISGNMIWARAYGGSGDDWCYEGIQAADGGYIIVGSTESFSADRDIFIMKTDSAGNPIWANIFPNPGMDEGFSILQITDGYIIAGLSAAVGGEDLITIKTDSLGRSCFSIPIVMPTTSVFPTYQPFNTYIHFGAITDTLSLSLLQGGTINTICFFDPIEENGKHNSSITIFPNPFKYKIKFEFQESEKYKFLVTDMTGKKVYEAFLPEKPELDLSFLSQGLYIATLFNDKSIFQSKIIKQ